MGILGVLFLLISQISFAVSSDYSENSLNWPVDLRDNEYKVGPILHQYQNFPASDHYFHEGVDLLGAPYQDVFTPVSGTIDAGYYSYVSAKDGTSIKTYISLRDIDPKDRDPKLWGANYFEISITDIFGNRFEFHHIDRLSLPLNIFHAVKNSEFIHEGMKIGNIIPWPLKVLGTDYSHIHYSIISKDGTTQLNPLWFSKKIKDTKAPEILETLFQLKAACPKTGRVKHFSVTRLSELDDPTHIIIRTKDFLGENHFPHPPTLIKTEFSDGSYHFLDFRYSMLFNQEHANINNVYVEELCYGDPSYPFFLKASETFDFYMKIPIPENFSGSASIIVSDYAGNETNTLVNIKK